MLLIFLNKKSDQIYGQKSQANYMMPKTRLVETRDFPRHLLSIVKTRNDS